MSIPSLTHPSAEWANAINVLCVRLDCLGDVLMTTPAIRALKQSQPDRRVTLLTSSSGAAAGKYIPEVDEVIVYDAPWMKAAAPDATRHADFALLDTLEASRFDAAVIFTVFSQNPLPAAMYCYLSGIPLRLAHCRENPYHLLTHWIRETEPESGIRHEVQRQLDLVASIGCRTEIERLSFRVRSADREFARGLLEEIGIDATQPWAVIHPGASAPSRRYPPQLFGEVIGRLTRQHGFQVVLTGNREEMPLVAEVQRLSAVPTMSVAGKLQLGQFAALLQAAPLLISNNSGPVHLAAAVGTPVVDLYALTNPQHTPWQVACRVLSHDVPCRNCFRSICPEQHQHCLSLIEPAAVVEAAGQLFMETGQERRPELSLTAHRPPRRTQLCTR